MQDFQVCFEWHLFNEWSDCFTVLYVCLSLFLSRSLSVSSVSVSLTLSPLSLPPPFSVSMCVWGWSWDFGTNYQLCTWQQHFYLFLLNIVFVFVLLCLLTPFYFAAANEWYCSVSTEAPLHEWLMSGTAQDWISVVHIGPFFCWPVTIFRLIILCLLSSSLCLWGFYFRKGKFCLVRCFSLPSCSCMNEFTTVYFAAYQKMRLEL